MSPTKQDIGRFWNSLYASMYTQSEAGLNADGLHRALDDLEDMFRLREHMAVVEMPLDRLKGLSVLEIGSGAGGHSALFARHGARVAALDLAGERARATQGKFEILGERARECQAFQGDAENLPFPDDCFDIVYSNGVLHHTVSTEQAIGELRRVLKPGGQFVIMLYCKSSWHYWINLLLCEGLLRGRLWRDPSWMGHATEWGGRDQQTVPNPITRCFTRAEMRTLFAAFARVSLRKREFYFYLMPKVGKYYRRWQLRRYGAHPGGLLVYGEPWPKQSPLEVALGKLMGWAWYASGYKNPGAASPSSRSPMR